MKATVGIYETHEQALSAIHKLKTSGFPMNKVSIMGQTDVHNPHSDADEADITAKAGKTVGIGALAGSTLGVLTGVGIFALPGLGFLFGAGALVGAIAGLDLGLIGGGIFGALSIGLSKEHHEKYDKYLKEGKFLLVIHGSEAETKHAQEILHEHGEHIELHSH
jgi:hypothetical protein